MGNGTLNQIQADPKSLPPADLAVTLSSKVRVLDDGRLLIGGSPLRALRVTSGGGKVLAGWNDGGRVGESSARRALARRLLDHDILCPCPASVGSVRSLTVVVPVRDRIEQLKRCVGGLRSSCPEAEIIVVDDASADCRSVAMLCDRESAKLIRHERPQGAAAARNTGLRASATPFVAFVDSDVAVPPGWAHRLLGYFADPRVGAVAPRVRALLPSRGAIGGYEERHSALDMGGCAGSVRPGGPVPYIPSATLIVRRAAASGGFDPGLPIGEDIDFVWRLRADGWQVRYAPAIHVWHEHRDTLRSFLARRRVYAMSVALLARRHPKTLPAARLNPRMAAPWALAAVGGRWSILGAASFQAFLIHRRLEGISDYRRRLAAMLLARELLGTGDGLARAVRRAWAPALFALPVRRRQARTMLAVAFVVPVLRDALTARELRRVPTDAALRILDELVALCGTWEGCLRERVIEPLLPQWDGTASR